LSTFTLERSTLAAYVRTWREGQGLRREDLASRSGLSLGAIQKVEDGRSHRPEARTIAALAAGMGADVRDLLALATGQ
jgi:transcriptional regulator with XRE-family HTH domain